MTPCEAASKLWSDPTFRLRVFSYLPLKNLSSLITLNKASYEDAIRILWNKISHHKASKAAEKIQDANRLMFYRQQVRTLLVSPETFHSSKPFTNHIMHYPLCTNMYSREERTEGHVQTITLKLKRREGKVEHVEIARTGEIPEIGPTSWIESSSGKLRCIPEEWYLDKVTRVHECICIKVEELEVLADNLENVKENGKNRIEVLYFTDAISEKDIVYMERLANTRALPEIAIVHVKTWLLDVRQLERFMDLWSGKAASLHLLDDRPDEDDPADEIEDITNASTETMLNCSSPADILRRYKDIHVGMPYFPAEYGDGDYRWTDPLQLYGPRSFHLEILRHTADDEQDSALWAPLSQLAHLLLDIGGPLCNYG